jgi:hypothetical protein
MISNEYDYPIEQFRCEGVFTETKHLVDPKKEYSIADRRDEYFHEFTIDLSTDSQSLSDIELASWNYEHSLETPYSGIHTPKFTNKAFKFPYLIFRSIYAPTIPGWDGEDSYFLLHRPVRVKGYFYTLNNGEIYAHASFVDLLAETYVGDPIEEDEDVQSDDDW